MAMTIGGRQSKLELWSIEIKGHLGAEDYLLSGTADNKRQHFLLIRLELNLQLFGGSQCLIFEREVVEFESDFFDVCILVHFILVEQDNASAVAVSLYSHVDLLPLDFSFLHL